MQCAYYKNEFFEFAHEKTIIDDKRNFPPHSHEAYEIYWFIGGEGTYHIEGSEYNLTPDTILIMRSAEVHMPKIEIGCEYDRATIHFDTQYLKKRDPKMQLLLPFTDNPPGINNMYRRDDFETGLIYNCFDNMSKISGDEYLDELRLSSTFYCILQELYDTHMRRRKNTEKVQDNLILQITKYIEEHLGEPLSLQTLQNKFYISKTHLTRIFKASMGVSVWEYIGIKRLTASRAMLRDGMRANVVAQKCGFGDYSAFYRAYKKRFGTAPSDK